MTIRDYFNRKKRRLMTIGYAGFAAFLGGIFLVVFAGIYGLVLCLPGFAVFFGTICFMATWAFRCPRCRHPWRGLALETGRYPVWQLDPRIRFCPYCGVDIDAKDSFEPASRPDELLD